MPERNILEKGVVVILEEQDDDDDDENAQFLWFWWFSSFVFQLQNACSNERKWSCDFVCDLTKLYKY